MTFMPTLTQASRAGVLLCFLVPPLQAEEALLKDGRHVVGALSLEATGHLVVTVKDKIASLPWDS
jgi:hypothetical protein